ncbi:hypothetical protein [Spirulina subsalsa]|uniref:hypothetical protein n=1 Tax=Spirulina subsalsa TaxID=54311 RepID=UPI00031FB63A|nr:hypothetical protein [Spirulina subsalsa]
MNRVCLLVLGIVGGFLGLDAIETQYHRLQGWESRLSELSLMMISSEGEWDGSAPVEGKPWLAPDRGGPDYSLPTGTR